MHRLGRRGFRVIWVSTNAVLSSTTRTCSTPSAKRSRPCRPQRIGHADAQHAGPRRRCRAKSSAAQVGQCLPHRVERRSGGGDPDRRVGRIDFDGVESVGGVVGSHDRPPRARTGRPRRSRLSAGARHRPLPVDERPALPIDFGNDDVEVDVAAVERPDAVGHVGDDLQRRPASRCPRHRHAVHGRRRRSLRRCGGRTPASPVPPATARSTAGTVDDLAAGSSPTRSSIPPRGLAPYMLACRIASLARSRSGPFAVPDADHAIVVAPCPWAARPDCPTPKSPRIPR